MTGSLPLPARHATFTPRAALVIPTLNEAESIGAVVASIPRDVVSRIIVADGGSTDATADIAIAAGAEALAVGRGYGRACIEGAEAAADCDVIVFMDGDGADDATQIRALVAPIASDSQDFVIGSRTRGNSANGRLGLHQVVAGRVLGGALGLLYGARYTDMCAFRAIRREALLALGMREMTYGWNLEMQMRAARAGLRILELPVDNHARIGGESKVSGSLRGSLHAGSRILATFGRVAFEPLRSTQER